MSQQNRVEERAVELFRSGFYCAESILMAVAERHGIQSDIIPAIATGFCSGMARRRGPCGALTGGIMAIGLVLGRKTPDASVEPAYEAVHSLLQAFENEFGSRECHRLLGCDLGSPQGQEDFANRRLIDFCTRVVGGTAAFAARILDPGLGGG